MNSARNIMTSLRARLVDAPSGPARWLWGAAHEVCLDDLRNGTVLGGRRNELAGRSVLIAARDQVAAAAALIELDGLARRLTLGTPELRAEQLAAIAANADADAIVTDHEERGAPGVRLRVRCDGGVAPAGEPDAPTVATEWVLLTSGTTGAPKMVVHTFESLSAPIRSGSASAAAAVWGTFYDIRRYGGLQFLFRAILGGGSFVLSAAGEPLADYLTRLAACGATHVSGTASHWRRALMSPRAGAYPLRYIRLSGEIADQPILNALGAFYPGATIAHAFASTEAGVAFEVDDGREGFPASIVETDGPVKVALRNGSLRIRSPRNAVAYLGEERGAIADEDGFVDTGDVVERRGDRYYFLGRRNGVINVGGLKVYPEEIETAINRHPAVRMSMVRAKRSPITGSLVTADVVLSGAPHPRFAGEILQICRDRLAPYKVPATIRFVPALELAAAGKLARHA